MVTKKKNKSKSKKKQVNLDQICQKMFKDAKKDLAPLITSYKQNKVRIGKVLVKYEKKIPMASYFRDLLQDLKEELNEPVTAFKVWMLVAKGDLPWAIIGKLSVSKLVNMKRATADRLMSGTRIAVFSLKQQRVIHQSFLKMTPKERNSAVDKRGDINKPQHVPKAKKSGKYRLYEGDSVKIIDNRRVIFCRALKAGVFDPAT